MDFTGERFIPLKELMDDEIAFEHLHRYYNSLNLVKGKVVLDIACGEGYGTAILSGKATKVFGVDIDKASIEHARKTYTKNNIEFIEGSVTKIPIPDGSVDIVISYETIEHIDEEAQRIFLSEIKRVLKKDGIFVISTPDKENYTDRYTHTNEFHIREFKRNEFVDFLKNYFENVSIYSQGYEIVDAITEEDPVNIKKIEVADWPRNSKPFTRKYILAICMDKQITEDINFSSVVFQVNKNFLDLMDNIVKKEAYIIELGAWGHKLDEEIKNKNKYIVSLQDEIEKMTSLSSANKVLEEEKKHNREIIQKQLTIIENLSFAEKEKEQLRTLLDTEIKEKSLIQQRLVETEKSTQHLEQSYSSATTSLAEKDLIVSNQSQTITFLKTKIEAYSKNIQKLEANDNDKEIIIQKLKEQEQNIYIQLEGQKRRLKEIYDSDGWKFLNKYYNLKGRLLHEDSRRYKFLKKTINLLRGKKESAKLTSNSIAATHAAAQQIIAENDNNQKVFDTLSFEAFENPVVSIIIPVYNGWEVTYRCLKSIHTNTVASSYEIIVADDGATDETKNIDHYVKNISVIRNEKNLGFLHNCNNAAEKAKGKYILFLNNDTEVKPAWLSHLVDLMKKDEKIGMTGSKFIYPDGRLQEAGGIIWKDGSAWNFGHGQSPDASEFNYVKEADYISGACILIRSALWKEIGGFDTRYAPAYCEDSDLAFEVRRKGYKVVYQPLSEVIHYEGYSHGVDGQAGSIKEYQAINNRKLKEKWHTVFQQEHFPNGENVFWAKDRSRNKKTILVVDHYVPQYDKDAGSKTVFQYLGLFVSMNMNVKFIGDNFYRDEPYTTTLQQMGIEVLYGPWYAQNWQQWIKDNHDKFDYILLNRPHITIRYIDFIKKNTKAKILYYGHDLHFVREMKQYEVEKSASFLKSAEKWKETEMDIFRKSDFILAPSAEESDQIKSLGFMAVAPIKPYMFTQIPVAANNFSVRKDILFVGGFSHLPNVDAILWFVKQVWPAVSQANPDIKFIIAGSNPPAAITNLASGAIEVLGYVPDGKLDSLYETSKVVVVPLRYGAGVKGKTVEAMFKGVPLITTSFGIEGLPGISSFTTPKDNAEDFAREVTRIYNLSDEDLKEISKKETEYITNHFMTDSAKSEFIDLLKKL